MPRDEIPKQNALYLPLRIHLSLCYPLFGRKLTLGIIGVFSFLDHLASLTEIGGGRKIKSEYLFPLLPLCKVTFGWLCSKVNVPRTLYSSYSFWLLVTTTTKGSCYIYLLCFSYTYMVIDRLLDDKSSNYPALSAPSVSCWYLTDTKSSQSPGWVTLSWVWHTEEHTMWNFS